MALETVIGLSFLAIAFIGYAVSRIPKKERFKFVDQKVKERKKTQYTIVLYI
jgi:uncharacterized Tic20 family protein